MNDLPAPRSASRVRCLLVGVAAIMAFVTLVHLLAPGLAPLPAGRRFDEQLVWCCTAAALAGSTWLSVLATVVAVEAARGVAPTTAGVPALLRRLVLGACGAALVGGIGAPAASASTTVREDPSRHLSPVLSGLPLPDRAAGPAGPGAGPDLVGAEVVVRAGDTLWAWARRSLPAGADDAAITVRWHRIYDLNRDRIGPDPDLIHPGLRLRLPQP